MMKRRANPIIGKAFQPYCVLGSMLIRRVDVWRWRVLCAFTTMTLVLLVAMNRMYLGAHFLSDEITAFA